VVGKPLAVYRVTTRGEYIYKWVSAARTGSPPTPPPPTAWPWATSTWTMGKLYVAKFNADGSGEWIELSIANPTIAGYATYPFADQADVCVNARLAADAVGATKMDRPEWSAVNPANGEVYFTLTNNSNRRLNPTGSQIAPDAANPRVYSDVKGTTTVNTGNVNGHIIRIKEAGERPPPPPSPGTSTCSAPSPRRSADQPVQPDRRPGLLQPGRPGVHALDRHLLDPDRRRRLHRRHQLHDAGRAARPGGRWRHHHGAGTNVTTYAASYSRRRTR
jgi:hypothetical protein